MDAPTFAAYWRTCLGGTVVHEFGHALGFLHEQYRRDAPYIPQEQACFDIARAQWGDDVPNPASWVQTGDVPLGPFDAESIMSYCRTNWSTYQPSAADFAAAQLVYGTRSPAH